MGKIIHSGVIVHISAPLNKGHLNVRTEKSSEARADKPEPALDMLNNLYIPMFASVEHCDWVGVQIVEHVLYQSYCYTFMFRFYGKFGLSCLGCLLLCSKNGPNVSELRSIKIEIVHIQNKTSQLCALPHVQNFWWINFWHGKNSSVWISMHWNGTVLQLGSYRLFYILFMWRNTFPGHAHEYLFWLL